MNTYQHLPLLQQICLGTIGVLELTFFIYLLVSVCILHSRRRYCLLAFTLTFITYILVQSLSDMGRFFFFRPAPPPFSPGTLDRKAALAGGGLVPAAAFLLRNGTVLPFTAQQKEHLNTKLHQGKPGCPARRRVLCHSRWDPTADQCNHEPPLRGIV